MKTVKTNKAPDAIGPYSQAIVVSNGLVFTSGQIGVDPATGNVVNNTIKSEIEQVLQNLDKIARQFDLKNLYVKRDDHANFLGGEEVRFYEFFLPYIKSNGYNTILNVNDYHSNDGIIGSMISKKYNLNYFLITTNAAHKHSSGNLLICKLFSNEVHALDEFWSSNIDAYTKRVELDLKKNNLKINDMKDNKI